MILHIVDCRRQGSPLLLCMSFPDWIPQARIIATDCCPATFFFNNFLCNPCRLSIPDRIPVFLIFFCYLHQDQILLSRFSTFRIIITRKSASRMVYWVKSLTHLNQSKTARCCFIPHLLQCLYELESLRQSWGKIRQSHLK